MKEDLRGLKLCELTQIKWIFIRRDQKNEKCHNHKLCLVYVLSFFFRRGGAVFSVLPVVKFAVIDRPVVFTYLCYV